MFDPDPPVRIIRFSAPRAGRSPFAQTDRQHLARLAQADPIAVRHSVGAAIHQLRRLSDSDDALARGISAL